MAAVEIHRGLSAVESRRLAWDKALGESRFPHFTQTWAWYRLVARHHAAAWEPLLLEARWEDRLLGLLPLLAHRERPHWVSPQTLLGLGGALPIGREVTATWLRIVARLGSLLPPGTRLDIGPIDTRTGVAARLDTACENIALRPTAKRTTLQREWSLDEMTAPDGRPPIAGPRPSVAASERSTTHDGITVVSSRGSFRGDDGLSRETEELLRQRLADPRFELVPHLPLVDVPPQAAFALFEELADAGLLVVTHAARPLLDHPLTSLSLDEASPTSTSGSATSRDRRVDRATERSIERDLIWVGDESSLVPLAELRPRHGASPLPAELRRIGRRLGQAGFRRIGQLPADWRPTDGVAEVRYRSFRFGSRSFPEQALHALGLSRVATGLSDWWHAPSGVRERR
ncbi:MAG TPA: hypothetical protein PLI18_14820 [Pirellulaceae bacterium]|nr:hypothetical protein [Pirellulaceae bacterium]